MPEPSRSPDDAPSWQLLHQLNDQSSLTPEGKATVSTALDSLERRLGGPWPCLQYERRGSLPPELIAFSSHTAVLPQLLMLFVRLEVHADDASFAPVLKSMRKTPDTPTWRHALLQLEVARAARAAGWPATHFPRHL